jgi:4-amino-4-deoxy-L-arabinose transferase-like glycosyltransferase
LGIISIIHIFVAVNMRISSILLISFLTRLIGITNPVLGWHSWRQSDTASIARNFFENGFNILYPQINWGASGTGFVESEFQIYSFIVSILYSIFGVDDIVGRFVSLLCSVSTVFGLYLLVKKMLNEKTAKWSALIYAILPLNIFYGRAFMPESLMLMCSVYSIYFLNQWLDKNSIKFFILAWFFTASAVLIKLPAFYLGLPLLYLAIQKYRIGVFKQLSLYILAICVLIPVVLWYYHAHQLFLNGGSSFGIWTYGQDKWGMFSLLMERAWYNDVFFKSIAERHLTYPAFILFIAGLFLKRTHPKEKLFDYWLIAVLIFIFIAAQAHRAQEYYTLPFTLPASVYAGKIFAKYIPSFRQSFRSKKLSTYFLFLCLLLICTLSYLRVARFFDSESNSQVVLQIGSDVKQLSGTNDKIITVSNGNPVYLYHSHRFGWTAMPQQLDTAYITGKVNEGAKFLAGEKNIFAETDETEKLNTILRRYQVLKNDSAYFILKLNY